jgi:uncharacterized protein (DUF2141 family)
MTRMKTSIFLALSSLMAGYAAAAPLTVKLENVEARGGQLYVSVQTEAQFMQNDGIDGTIVNAPVAGAHSFAFDLPEGRYAVAVWHDDDGDGAFNRVAGGDRAGWPLDGWAMINGRAMRGVPSFAEASVAVGADGAVVTEAMTYGR